MRLRSSGNSHEEKRPPRKRHKVEIEEVWTQGILDAGAKIWSIDLSEKRFQPILTPPSDSKFGDAACGVAFRLARDLKKAPKAIAEELVGALPDLPGLAKVEVAGAGYLNFQASTEFHADTIKRIRSESEKYGRSPFGNGRRVLVEHCSANPTGPLHVAHGRQAAIGDALSNLLDFAGYDVDREYYVNDTGGQIENLGKSILKRMYEKAGRDYPDAENLYQGEYIIDIAETILEKDGEKVLERPDAETYCGTIGKERLLDAIKKDLLAFRVQFDTWFSQEGLETGGAVDTILDIYRKNNQLFEKDGATWFTSKDHGDVENKVLIKTDGKFTYRTPDLAYHKDKFDRGYEILIDLYGPDHHAHIGTMKAGLRMLGFDMEPLEKGSGQTFEVLIVQYCKLLRDGVEVKMSKRAASYVTLEELMEEVGVDAARYFFLMRKTNTPLEFDIEVAKKKTLENPVYYSQYAHARICSILAKGREKEMIEEADIKDGVWMGDFSTEDLGPNEIELVRACRGIRRTVETAARNLDVAILTDFVSHLSGAFQRYYQKQENTVLDENEPARRARLAACSSVQVVLRNVFRILDISAPERL